MRNFSTAVLGICSVGCLMACGGSNTSTTLTTTPPTQVTLTVSGSADGCRFASGRWFVDFLYAQRINRHLHSSQANFQLCGRSPLPRFPVFKSEPE